MKINNFKEEDLPAAFHLYCSACGREHEVNATKDSKKYLVALFQSYIEDNETNKVVKYILHIKFICPFCGVKTDSERNVKDDCSEWLQYINLYTDTREDNT